MDYRESKICTADRENQNKKNKKTKTDKKGLKEEERS